MSGMGVQSLVVAAQGVAESMREFGEVVITITPRVEGFQRALRVARGRILRPYIVAERKKFRIIARRWRRAEIEAKRRRPLLHKGRNP